MEAFNKIVLGKFVITLHIALILFENEGTARLIIGGDIQPVHFTTITVSISSFYNTSHKNNGNTTEKSKDSTTPWFVPSSSPAESTVSQSVSNNIMQTKSTTNYGNKTPSTTTGVTYTSLHTKAVSATNRSDTKTSKSPEETVTNFWTIHVTENGTDSTTKYEVSTDIKMTKWPFSEDTQKPRLFRETTSGKQESTTANSIAKFQTTEKKTIEISTFPETVLSTQKVINQSSEQQTTTHGDHIQFVITQKLFTTGFPTEVYGEYTINSNESLIIGLSVGGIVLIIIFGIVLVMVRYKWNASRRETELVLLTEFKAF